jgi:hypothetical protein
VDISSTLVGKSAQLDNVDLMGGPRDFTVVEAVVREGHEQPLVVTLAEYDRPWLPGVTMRRLIAAMWGQESDAYKGRRVRLYRDPDVTFGKDKTGGTRISHASHIDNAITVSLPTSKGKFGAFMVQPLPDAPRSESVAQGATSAEPTLEAVTTCTDLDALKVMWKASGPERREQITARVAEIKATTVQGELGAES